jgi:cell division septation protein DedD
MRFEIRAGGFVVILIGLLGLSGVVFFFGVLAGNDIAKQNTPDPGQVSSVYPLPAPPSVAASPAVAPMAAVNPTSAPVAIPPPVHARPPVFTPMAASSPAAVVSSGVAAAPHPANTRAVAKLSSPAAAPERSARKHPFNIQIEAVMDRNGAQQMVNRLQSLGYPAGMETTDIEGQTWYRVRVGPYDSEDDAQAAQQKLRDEYKQKFAPH